MVSVTAVVSELTLKTAGMPSPRGGVNTTVSPALLCENESGVSVMFAPSVTGGIVGDEGKEVSSTGVAPAGTAVTVASGVIVTSQVGPATRACTETHAGVVTRQNATLFRGAASPAASRECASAHRSAEGYRLL